MKYIKNILLSASLIVLAACTEDDANYSTTDKPVVSMTGQTATSVMEGETITVSLATNKTYKEALDLKLELVSGGQNADYFVSNADGDPTGATTIDDGLGTFGYQIHFPAYAETHSFNITATKDVLLEGTENLRFKLTSSGNGNALVTNNEIFIDLEISNFVEDRVIVTLDFDKEVTYNTIERNIIETELDDETISHRESLCNLVDYDLYFDSFHSWTDCPEMINSETADGLNSTAPSGPLADGDYNIVVELYGIDLGLDDDVNEILDGDFALPFTIKVDHVGSFNASMDFPLTYFTNVNPGPQLVGVLNVQNGKYTLLDADGNIVAAE